MDPITGLLLLILFYWGFVWIISFLAFYQIKAENKDTRDHSTALFGVVVSPLAAPFVLCWYGLKIVVQFFWMIVLSLFSILSMGIIFIFFAIITHLPKSSLLGPLIRFTKRQLEKLIRFFRKQGKVIPPDGSP